MNKSVRYWPTSSIPKYTKTYIYKLYEPVEVAEKHAPHPAAGFPASWAYLPVAQAQVGHAPHS